MKRIIISGLIILAAIGGIAYVLRSNKAKNEAQTAIVAQKNASVAVRAEVADYKQMNMQYAANGTFSAKQEVMISSEVSGKITNVLVREGAFVRAGQVLAVIRGDKLNVTLSNAQAVYENAKNEVERFESAYATGGVTKQQLDQIKLQLENARNNLQNARLTASDVNVKASFAGVVNKRSIEAGSYVSPGQQMFEIVNVSSLKQKVYVDEKNISSIKLGQQVKVETPVLPGKTWTGVVSFIAPKADGSLNFPVEIEIKNNPNNELKAGMYGTTRFGSDQTGDVLVVPRNAFVGNISSNQVFVIQDGKAILTQVVSGRNFGDYIEILSGVSKGQKVVVSGQINLLDQTLVEVIN
ncbi:RND transporter [Sporocytophaga myxococcoides]|uniref:RND transporter n=1 Tax=Sporocytophaga myxococcoides TaxID=153721 RepID=A0A098LH69_9BACT|nr:efflux RND transporter periplasmic adaptor subunit [Sporocytophaga myxococcoides]GAL85752.1 RND transporter [Sporocytophaga myxococcoides]